MKRLFVLALLLFISAAPLLAQKPAPIELGFKPGRVYDFGSIDHVNTFNGNLLVSIPIGRRYHVSSNLSYGLQLVYNSKIWDYRYLNGGTPGCDPFLRQCQTIYYKWARPNRRSNASMGWRVSLGRLIPPDQWTSTHYPEDSNGWMYEGPSGDEHSLNTYNHRSNDGSYLRMRTITSTTRVVEFPDGAVHTFLYQRNGWRLQSIADRSGHQLTVTYSYWSSTDDRVTDWHLSDSHNRTHRVHFVYFSEAADSIEKGMNVGYVQFDGATGPRYDFHYTTTPFTYFGPYHDVPGSFSGGPGNTPPPQNLLTSISLPDETSYGFAYHIAADPNAEGLLREITLPTLGKIAYTHDMYKLPSADPCVQTGPRNTTPGIHTRALDGSTWTYKQITETLADVVYRPLVDQSKCAGDLIDEPPSVRAPQRWSRTSILSPPDAQGSRSRTDHYFNIFAAHPNFCDERLHGGMRNLEYGEPGVVGWPGSLAGEALPATSTPEPTAESADAADSTEPVGSCDSYEQVADQRYLARQVWSGCDAAGNCSTPLRSVYVRHGSAQGAGSDGRPIQSERSVMLDDTGCGAGTETCYAQTDYSDSDGVGHWRTVTTSSNFPGTSGGSTFTNYPSYTTAQLDDPNTKWVFNRYTETRRTINEETERSTYCFSDDGLLLRKRTHAGTAAGASDLVTEYGYTSGNLTEEKGYGGDVQAIDTTQTDLCLTPLADPQYWNRYGYDSGVLASAEYIDPAGGNPVGFKSLDYTIDDATGLVSESRGTDGLATSYTYKTWGALESVTPPGEAQAVYSYTPATATAFAKVSMTKSDITTTWEYDRLGRHSRTSRTLPDAACAEQSVAYHALGRTASESVCDPACVEQWVTYDALGRKASESVWESCGTSGGATTYRYDSFGRVLSITAPDAKVTSYAYQGNRVVTRTNQIATSAGAEAGVSTEEQYDGGGRLLSVTENTGDGAVKTSYEYDAANRLIGVCSKNVDGVCGQERSFTYDGRGFLKSETHPENGTTSYTRYDARGHAQERTSASGAKLTFTFDAAERLTEVWFGTQPLKSFTFGTANEGSNLRKGKLWAATRFNVLNGAEIRVTETYAYGNDAGQASSRTTKVERKSDAGWTEIQTFSVALDYDVLGLPKSVTMPTCSMHGCAAVAAAGLSTVGFVRKQGWLTEVTDFASFTYHPSGMVKEVRHRSIPELTDTYETTNGIPRPSKIAFAGAIACTPPPAPFITAPVSVPAGSSGNTASVQDQSGVTYRWTISGGTLTSGTTGTSVTFSAPSEGTITLSVTASNACSTTGPSMATVTVCAPLTEPVITAPAAVPERSTGHVASVTQQNGVTYQWQVTGGNITAGSTASSVTFDAPSPGTITLTVIATRTGVCSATASSSVSIVVHTMPSAPAWVEARTLSDRSVSVSWPATSGAVSYRVERASTRGGAGVLVASVTSTSITDLAPASAQPVTYVYYVRAIGTGGAESPRGAHDYATTASALFSRAIAAELPILTADVAELRLAVNALRAATGLGTAFDGGPEAGQVIAAADLTNLVTALNAARREYPLAPFGYSGVREPAPGGAILAQHILQLREALR